MLAAEMVYSEMLFARASWSLYSPSSSMSSPVKPNVKDMCMG